MSKSEPSLARLLRNEFLIENLQGTTPERIVGELLECIGAEEDFSPEVLQSMQRSILAREKEATTGIGNGVAIPHMKQCTHVSQIRAAFGRAPGGVEFAAADGEPVFLFLVMLIPPGGESEHIQVMRKVVQLSRDRKTMRYLIAAPDFTRLAGILEELDGEAA